MKIILINDTHFGCRNDSQIFVDMMEDFFSNQLFPYMKKNNIGRIIHLGDMFDRRKSINFKTLYNTQRIFIDPIIENDYYMDVIVGNHDCYHLQSNEINSPQLLLGQYEDNIHFIVDKPNSIMSKRGGYCGLVPWITKDNYEECIKFIKDGKNDILLGHFEIKGFEMMPGIKNEVGLKQSLFKDYEMVLSGHFHIKSNIGNITYLGSQYEMSWADYNDTKGFHVLDLDTKELEYIENPNKMFYKIIYNDEENNYAKFDASIYKNKYVKIIVTKKTKPENFDMLVDKIQNVDPADIKIIENDVLLNEENVDVSNVEDTATLLNNYIESVDIDADKSKIKNIMNNIYTEALEMS